MADTAEPPKLPSDALESTLALVLKETGKFFRASQSSHSGQIGVVKAAIAQAIPAANQRFHEALDEIEIEIVRPVLCASTSTRLTECQIRAKSVFERDLSSIRAKRAERERAAAGILKARGPIGVTKESAPNGNTREETKTADPSATDQAKPPAEDAANNDTKDIPMTDGPASIPDHEPPSENYNPPINDTVKIEPFSIPHELPQSPSQPKGLAISLDREAPSTSAPTAPAAPEANNPPSTQLSEEAPISANPTDADFDSIFNDTDLPAATDDIDFDLAFSAEDATNPTDLLNESAFQNISIPTGDNQNANSTNASHEEDITTLLPGLENYVNSSMGHDDFASAADIAISAGFPNSTTDNQNPIVGAKTTMGTGDAGSAAQIQSPIEAEAAPIESSFEDMFGIDSYMNGTGDDELAGSGEVGDFDEDWFNSI
ncbi:MAG: hypothetical protein Q9181_007530 [Wetmoreana brouardii]